MQAEMYFHVFAITTGAIDKSERGGNSEDPATYLLRRAGQFAQAKTAIQADRTFKKSKYTFGESKVKAKLVASGSTERLYITDEGLKTFLETLNVKPAIGDGWDLRWKHILDITDAISGKIRDTMKSEETLSVTNLMGRLQYYCAFPKVVPKYKKDAKKWFEIIRGLRNWFDWLNALMFGVEASRMNSVFVTGVMLLQSMCQPTSNKTAKTAREWLERFPLATTGTGRNNFVAEELLLLSLEWANEHKLAVSKRVDASVVRLYPKWLACTLKSFEVISSWADDFCSMKKPDNTEARLKKFDNCVTELLETHYLSVKSDSDASESETTECSENDDPNGKIRKKTDGSMDKEQSKNDEPNREKLKKNAKYSKPAVSKRNSKIDETRKVRRKIGASTECEQSKTDESKRTKNLNYSVKDNSDSDSSDSDEARDSDGEKKLRNRKKKS